MKRILILFAVFIMILGSASPALAASSEQGFYNPGSAADLSITFKDASGEVSSVAEDVDGNGTSDTFYPGSDRLTVTFSNAVSGEEYLAMLVRGTALPSNLEDSKYYDIRQSTASGSSVTFALYPKTITNSIQMTLFITNSSDETVISMPMYYWAGHSTYLIGDGNDDGRVNMSDRVLLTRYIAQWEGVEQEIKKMDAFDIDSDGSITAKDRVILSRYLAKWGGSWNSYFDQ